MTDESIQNKPDYFAPNIAEASRLRGRGVAATEEAIAVEHDAANQRLARWLMPATIAVPLVLWGVLSIGLIFGHVSPGASLALFAILVTVTLTLMVWRHLKKLHRMDAQRAQTQAQLKTARDAAENANRFKSAFFANISHEIRTPLTAINGFAELMLNPERTEDDRLSDARVIRRNGEHLLTLINDILDLSKIEAGKMTVDPILYCPALTIGEVKSMLKHRAAEKGVALEVAFDSPIPKLIRTDPTRLRQVLINLVANAIKFTKDGSVKLTAKVTPSFKAMNPMFVVTIEDTGIGIPEDQVGSLFQPFVQADATISRQYGGSGLGLAISRHFAQALGGDITVTSQLGKGSTFTVTVATGSLVDAVAHEKPEEAMDQQVAIATQKVKIAGNVLLAEDGLDNQALIATKLRDTGLTVEVAPNGQVAVDLALKALEDKKPFDLILMDVQMPVMDGFTATHTLRGKGYRGPIVALTANAMDRDKTKCLTAGCNDFVTKPIAMDKLFKAMGRFMTVTAVVPSTGLMQGSGAEVDADRAALVQKFYDELTTELTDLDESITRQDRERFRELVQLIVGRAAAAGLKEIAPQAAKLLMASEGSWNSLTQEVAEFKRELQPPTERRAA